LRNKVLTIRNPENRKISAVAPLSIAFGLGIQPGDVLLSIDGSEVLDVFDFRIRELTESLSIRFMRPDGTETETSVKKDADEELGLSFENPLLDDGHSCSNKCVFCFIDQLPKGMRQSLYFKDDDLRLSFLTGNYVTLTNVDDKEYERLLSYHLSPMNVSVHATDPAVRSRMMNNRFAGNLMDRLKLAVSMRITVNCQIVLCPGINDGSVLEQTITDLLELGEGLCSIAVVPVGLTRFREMNELPDLKPFDRESAQAVLDLVDKYQKTLLKTRGERLFFAADEFYIRADRPIPPAKNYDGFPQLENGVGLLSARRDEIQKGISNRKRRKDFAFGTSKNSPQKYWLISGTDAAPFCREVLKGVETLYNDNIEVLAVTNRFFGDKVTVTGLLTGGDILGALLTQAGIQGKPDAVLLPDVALKSGETVFLDDMTVEILADRSGLRIIPYASTGEGLLNTLDFLCAEAQKIDYLRGGCS